MRNLEDDIRVAVEPIAGQLLFLSANANTSSPLAVAREFSRVRRKLKAIRQWHAWRAAIHHEPDATWEQVAEDPLCQGSCRMTLAA